MGENGEITEFRAALYLRTATQHPQYSTNTQSDKIRDYASKRGIEIVRTYTDEGIRLRSFTFGLAMRISVISRPSKVTGTDRETVFCFTASDMDHLRNHWEGAGWIAHLRFAMCR